MRSEELAEALRASVGCDKFWVAKIDKIVELR